MEEVDAIVVKEKKEDLKKIWNKVVKMGIGIRKAQLKISPVALKIVSIFAPDAAPILITISSFLSTDTGKKVTEIATKGYDTVGNVLTGDINAAKESAKDAISIINADEAVKMAYDAKNFITKVKGIA